MRLSNSIISTHMQKVQHLPVHGAFVVARHLEHVALLRVVQHAADVGVAIHPLSTVMARPAAHVRVPLAGFRKEGGDARLVRSRIGFIVEEGASGRSAVPVCYSLGRDANQPIAAIEKSI